MESSSEQILLIGVNLFILIAALTCAIMLMSAVLNMSNAANDTIKTTTGSSLMNWYGDTKERVYTGEQVIAIVKEYLSPTTNIEEKYILQVNSEKVNEDFSINSGMLKSTYHLKYNKENDEITYNFEKIQAGGNT